LLSSDPRLDLAQHEIVAQGELVEESWKSVRNSHENLARYNELKASPGRRGRSTPICCLKYTDASTFFEYPVANCMALGLHSQILKMMRGTLWEDEFNRACKRFDKRAAFILCPSLLKRPVKRMLPESSLNLLSAYKVEDHQHAMKNYHVLVFHRGFANEMERNLFTCKFGTICKVYHLYWRFLSCAMFLFRRTDETWATISNSEEEVKRANDLILHHRGNFDRDVEVLCKLCEEIVGPTSCTPNLHSLHHIIRRLVVLKGHPTFEIIVKRLVSTNPFRDVDCS